MTTAHRPTWNSAAGGSNQGGNKMMHPSRMYSSKDLPGYNLLKERQLGQGNLDEIQNKDFKRELLESEKEYFSKKQQKDQYKLNDQQDDEPQVIKKIKQDSDQQIKTSELTYANPFPQDADDDDQKSNSKDRSDDDDDDDSDNDLLMQEFEKIKKEREEEAKRKEIEKQQDPEYMENRSKDILKGNPLLETGTYSLQKKWFEDTVFKNQNLTEAKEKKRFINDSVRSDFHKKFMNKYVLN